MDQVLPELTRYRSAAALAALPLLLLGCDRPASRTRGADSSPAQAARGVVDSALAPDEALRRFRAGLVAPKSLGGAGSRDELYRRFADALRRKDEASLAALSVTRAEYAFLLYPELAISRPPYSQPPDVAWMLSLNGSRAGYTKLLARAAEFTLQGYRCGAQPSTEGRLRIWTDCRVKVQSPGGARELRLFGPIVERDGRFRIMTFDNDL